MNEENKETSPEEEKLLSERWLERRKLELQDKELEVRKLEIESKMAADKKPSTIISPVTATILVALISFLGTAIGTYLQGRNTNALERDKFVNDSQQEKIRFQSSLITKALEGQTQSDRIKFLTFLTKIRLIEDTSLANRIDLFVETTPDEIPNLSTTFVPPVTKENKDLYTTCVVNPTSMNEANKVVDQIVKNRPRYENVSRKTNIPWQVIALLHYKEAAFNFNSHLANGDPLTARTVNIPAGHPVNGNPPFTWEESAADYLLYTPAYKNGSWMTTKGLLDALEASNGLGYRKTGVVSPYLWAGSNHYLKGAYTPSGIFDPNVAHKQLGAAVVLKVMEQRGLYTYQSQ